MWRTQRPQPETARIGLWETFSNQLALPRQWGELIMLKATRTKHRIKRAFRSITTTGEFPHGEAWRILFDFDLVGRRNRIQGCCAGSVRRPTCGLAVLLHPRR